MNNALNISNTTMASTHEERQRIAHEGAYSGQGRSHVTSEDPLVRYITRWRIQEAMARVANHRAGIVGPHTSIVVLCAGEGLEGSVLADLGFGNVLVTDITENGVNAALTRDTRLQGQVENATAMSFADNSFDIALVQDGLHHLCSPIAGFTEMLRIARYAAIFLEPHDSIIGNLIGTRWERNGDATNYVFRWTRRLVQDTSCSFLGAPDFDNLSFAFWHHNVLFHKLGKAVGDGSSGILTLKLLKRVLDTVAGRQGNQFCGIVVKRP